MSNSALAMRSVDRLRGRFRSYHVSECRSLFGEPALFVTWGTIGRTPRTRLETFASEEMRAGRWSQLLARRSAHGYTVNTGARE
jgi:predicted DNA-binding WGR domain protein